MEHHAPTLTTERLVLRPFTHDDAEFIVELLNQPSWKRFIGDRGIDSLAAAHGYIETALLGAYRQHGFGLLAVQLKEGAALIGMCGLLKRDTLDDIDIGFAMLPRFEGQGLAYEAAMAMVEYSRDVLGLKRLVGIVAPDNERSARLLSRIGMHYETRKRLSSSSNEVALYAMSLAVTKPC